VQQGKSGWLLLYKKYLGVYISIAWKIVYGMLLQFKPVRLSWRDIFTDILIWPENVQHRYWLNIYEMKN
jgi:hypothetical protein